MRWTITNDCGTAVAILIATCSQSAGTCDRPGAPPWKYLMDGIVLPGKYQRTVTEAEQTQTAEHIDHAACVVTNSAAIRLIGMTAEIRSSVEWQIEFELVRSRDGCLSNVRALAAAGRRTGLPIDALLGVARPAKDPGQGAKRF